MGKMIDPYADDGDDDNVNDLVKTMNEFEAEEGDEQPRGRAREPTQRDDEYEYDSADTPDEFEVGPKKAPPRAREERRQDRGSYREAYNGSRDENDRLRKRLEALEDDNRRGRDRDQGDDAEAVYEKKKEGMIAERERLIEDYNRGQTAGSLGPKDAAAMRTQARDIDTRLNKLDHDKWTAEAAPTPNQQRASALNATLSARAPDVYGNRVAHGLLLAKYQARREAGESDSMELHDRVCDDVRDEMGLRGERDRPRPTAHERSQYDGIPRGGARTSRRASASKGHHITEAEKKLADISHAHIPDQRKRHQAWVNDVVPLMRADPG